MTDKKTAHKPAHKATEPNARDVDQPKATPGKHIAGEHITQTKPDMADALAHTGPNATMDDIGKGSVTVEAPAVRGTAAETTDKRVVQQGDEVVIITRNPVNGETRNHGKVLKVNDDSSIAVRVPRNDGNGVFDFSPVYNSERNGESHWVWPDHDQL